MVNYAIEPKLLEAHLPQGTELDEWNGKTYVSMVGFLFLRTKVAGMRIPGHSNFEEVNLRFYVRRRAADGWRRGVVFIKEIVPRRLIATVARVCYHEPYLALPMRHSIDIEQSGAIEYAWRYQGKWNSLSAVMSGPIFFPTDDSHEAFISEHYWGYNSQRNGRTMEYKVEHPQWQVWPARDASFQCDVAGFYGSQFVETLGARPESAFVALGSAVTVSYGVPI